MFPAPRLLARPGAVPRAGEPIWADPVMVTPMPSPRDARRSPDESAAALVVLEPGGDAVTALDALPASGLSDEGLIDALAASEKQLAAIVAKQVEFLAEVARRDAGHDQFLREEAAFALAQSDNAVEAKLEEAEQLVGRLADTLDLVRSGCLSYPNARILAHAIEPCSDEVTAKVQDAVLPRGCRQTPGEFRAAVRRAIARVDRKTEAERHAEQIEQRKVVHYPDADCMADIWLRLGADGAAIVMNAINAWAVKTDRGDPRTVDQRRADAIVEICQAALAMPGLPHQHGARPAVNITLAASTLARADDQPGELSGGPPANEGVAGGGGYGPIPADIARRWAQDPTATRHWWLVDAEGRILDRRVPDPGHCAQSRDANGSPPDRPGPGLTSPHYVPPASLARHVITRDQYCTAPGCRRRAWHCDLDHRVPWPAGPTSAENLAPMCRRHHRMKHHPGWTLRKHPDGSYEWTSPTRHTYHYRPPERPIPEPEPPPTAPENDDPPPF